MKLRPDLLANESPEGLEVIQLTVDSEVPFCHIYPEARIFTPDSTRLVLHGHATPHGGDLHDPRRQYFLCDLTSNAELSPLTDETGAYAPCVSPDGRFFYYFIRQDQRTSLKRVDLQTGERCTLSVIDGYIPGTRLRIANLSPLATIRQDGKAIALPVFLGQVGESFNFGMIVFDLETNEQRLILCGPSWSNVHPQYCLSSDPQSMYDLLIQDNHGCLIAPDGNLLRHTAGRGCDIHMIRDDGTNFRTLAWGRDKVEQCRGHQCWRGHSTYAIGSVTIQLENGDEKILLMEGEGFATTDHLGKYTPDTTYNEITRHLTHPKFDHFATDLAGERLISDGLFADGWKLSLSRLGVPGEEGLGPNCYLLDTKADINVTPKNITHPHPFFSPDGKMAFFNSNESGTLQAYMLRNLPNL